MKIIDLLNKIANGEKSELLTKFKCDKEIYNMKKYLDTYAIDVFSLNEKVEIIEENNKIKKIETKMTATLNCIKDSETILDGEYYVIHSDFILALEEEVNELKEEIHD